jgi:hypothetical protein
VDTTACAGLRGECRTDEDCCADMFSLYCNEAVGQCWER